MITIITLFDIDLEKEEVFVFDFKTNGKTFEGLRDHIGMANPHEFFDCFAKYLRVTFIYLFIYHFQILQDLKG
jgi:hypothetical protein